MAQTNITAVELTDTFNTFRTRSNTGYVAVNALTGIVDPDNKAIVSNGTGSVTLSPSNGTVTISPTGTGSVSISPATTVLISPAGALTIGTSGQTTTVNASTVTLANATTWNINGANPTLSSTSTGTLTLFNSALTTVNAFQAATSITIGATTGTATIRNANTVVSGDLAVNGGDITTTSTAATLFNSTATSLNIGQAATSISIGATTGTITVNNANSIFSGDVAVNGGDITTTATTFNIATTSAATVNAFSQATLISIGSTSGTYTINNATFSLPNATTLNINGANPTLSSTSTGTLTLFNTGLTTVNAFGAATSVTIGATTGTTTVRNNLTVSGNLTVNGTTTTVNSTVTTIDDPIIMLGGDTDLADITKDRGIEFRHSAASITITQITTNGTDSIVTATVASTTGYRTGDSITTTGATANAALNGTFRITVVNATTFTFSIGVTLAAQTFTTGLGTTIKSDVGFVGFDVSANEFVFYDQSENSNEVITGNLANIRVNNITGTITGSVTAANTLNITDDTTTNATYYPSFAIGTTGSQSFRVSSTKLTFNPSSGILSSVDYNSTSDERLKKNIKTVSGLSVIEKLRGVEFNFVDNNRLSSGVIAQEIENILPHVVNSDGEFKTVSYQQIIAYLIESIKELKSEIDFLKTK